MKTKMTVLKKKPMIRAVLKGRGIVKRWICYWYDAVDDVKWVALSAFALVAAVKCGNQHLCQGGLCVRFSSVWVPGDNAWRSSV